MVGLLMVTQGRMLDTIRRESYGQTSEMLDDLAAIAGRGRGRSQVEVPPKPPDAVSNVARGFINGAMSVRNNYRQIMCASRMMHGREFAPPSPGPGGPDFC